MTQLSVNELDPVRQQLLEAKLGKLLNWEVPDIQPSIGPCDPNAFLEFESKRLGIVEACRDRLRNYGTKELDSLLGVSSDTATITIAFWKGFLREAIENLPRLMPPWYAGGFGHPDHAADFQYWAKMPNFTVTELTCLSIGIEPDRFPKEKVFSLQKAERDRLWPAVHFLLRRHEQLQRRFGLRARDLKVEPAEFLAWIASVDFDVHPVFLGLLQQYHSSVVTPPPAATKAGSADKREINTIAKIIAVLAIKKFRYDPQAARSEVPKKIADLAAENGIRISEETVLKYLRRGASLASKAGQDD